MFETSKDVLNLVLAAAVTIFTIFVCWLLYYLISIIGTSRKIVQDVQSLVKSLEETLKAIKDKVGQSPGAFLSLINGVSTVVDYIKKKKDKKNTNSKKK
ncbi:MAG: hypothetical protein PHH01_02335 [Patescibacteria group bacterium]|nr:hypothetical protein [Patescibacteria group bacterium]MDD5567010.1 hypothetical protein [Patescibacteria group bacterium]